MTPATILTLLLSLPATASPDADRPARLATIATAIADVAHSPAEAAAIVTVIWHESHLDALIHAGADHPRWKGDLGKARCLGQIHLSRLVAADWNELTGTDLEHTTNCIRATLRVLKSASWTGGGRGVFESGTIARTFAAYGAGHAVAPPRWAVARGEFFERVRRRLY